MIDLLIALVIVVAVIWIVVWVVSYLPAPTPVKNIIVLVAGLLMLIWFLERVGVSF